MPKDKIESEKILKAIREIQNKSIDSLKGHAQSLKSSVESLLIKIDTEGVNGQYSINSDCLRYSESVWRNSLRLGELKLLEKNIEDQIRKNSKEKSKNELDKDT